MSDEIIIEYHGKELSDFQLKRVMRAMAYKYPKPITAFLGDVFISAECAVGVVFGHKEPGPFGQHADGHIFKTVPIYQLWKRGRFWVCSTRSGNYVLTSFKRESGRPSLNAFIAMADDLGVPAEPAQ